MADSSVLSSSSVTKSLTALSTSAPNLCASGGDLPSANLAVAVASHKTETDRHHHVPCSNATSAPNGNTDAFGIIHSTSTTTAPATATGWKGEPLPDSSSSSSPAYPCTTGSGAAANSSTIMIRKIGKSSSPSPNNFGGQRSSNRDEWKSRMTTDSFISRLARHVAKNSLKAKVGALTDVTEDEFLESRETDPDAPEKFARDFYRELFVNRYTKLRKSVRDNNEAEISMNNPDEPACSFLPPRMSKQHTPSMELVGRIRPMEAGEEESQEAMDLEDLIAKCGDSAQEKKRILRRLLKIVLDLHLALTTFSGLPDELMLRDGCLTKHGLAFRHAFAVPTVDKVLGREVHWLLIENLPSSFLVTYLDLLQHSRHRLHLGLVDSLVMLDSERKTLSQEIMIFVHKKPMAVNILTSLLEPQTPTPQLPPFQKLSRDFLFIMVSPSLTIVSEQKSSSKMRHEIFFKRLLPLLGRSGAEVKFGANNRQLAVGHVMEHMKLVLREKIAENKKAHPNADIVLIGWDTSCLLACRAAREFRVAAVICLAFPNVTINGIRGDVDDDLLTLSCPVLFVCGQFSTSCSVDDLQDTRDMMQSETGLVVVGGADHQLRMSSKKLRMESICQDAVDCAVLETIGDFLVFMFDNSVEKGINDFNEKDVIVKHKGFARELFDAKFSRGSLKRNVFDSLEYHQGKYFKRQQHEGKSNRPKKKHISSKKHPEHQMRIGFPSEPPPGAISLSREGSADRAHPPIKVQGPQKVQKQMSRSLLLLPHGGIPAHPQSPKISGGDAARKVGSGGGLWSQPLHPERHPHPIHGQFWHGQRLTNSPYFEEDRNPPSPDVGD